MATRRPPAARSGADPVTVPIASLFSIKERVTFEIAIPNAIQAYKKRNGGQSPRTHEQFMQNVIAGTTSNCPTRRPATSYLYDPAKEELQVVKDAEENRRTRPKKSDASGGPAPHRIDNLPIPLVPTANDELP